MNYGCVYRENGSPFHYRRKERVTGGRIEEESHSGKEVRFEGLGALLPRAMGLELSLHPRRLPGQMFKHSEAA